MQTTSEILSEQCDRYQLMIMIVNHLECEGSINLLEVMTQYNVKKIVFSSSATFYGQPVYLPIDEDHPVGDCVNPYGKTKFFMEEIFKVNICITGLQSKENIFVPGCLFV